MRRIQPTTPFRQKCDAEPTKAVRLIAAPSPTRLLFRIGCAVPLARWPWPGSGGMSTEVACPHLLHRKTHRARCFCRHLKWCRHNNCSPASNWRWRWTAHARPPAAIQLHLRQRCPDGRQPKWLATRSGNCESLSFCSIQFPPRQRMRGTLGPAISRCLLNGGNPRRRPSHPAYICRHRLGRIFDSAPLEIVWVPVVTDIDCAA